MSKYEDEALELIELVAENSHHHAAKSFGGRSAPAKGGMLDAKAAETSMHLDKIEKLTEAQNLIMDSLKIQPGSNGLTPLSHVDISPYSHCSSFEHVELDCPVMAIQGPYLFRPNPTTYLMKAQKVCINTKIYLYLAKLTRKPIMISTIARVNNFIPSIHQTRNFIHHFFVSLFSRTYKYENGS